MIDAPSSLTVIRRALSPRHAIGVREFDVDVCHKGADLNVGEHFHIGPCLRPLASRFLHSKDADTDMTSMKKDDIRHKNTPVVTVTPQSKPDTGAFSPTRVSVRVP